jgi:DNA-directed RNA polymerase subunit RPC12/RpoP
MACEYCGSRMLAKVEGPTPSGPRLMCADCGHSLVPERQAEGIRKAWMAASGLGLILLMGCITFAVATLQEIHHSGLGNDPALEGSLEKLSGASGTGGSEGAEAARAQ